MKKITFIPSKQKKELRISTLLKEINSMPCKINIDFTENIFTVTHIEETQLDIISHFIDEYYEINSISIDNTADDILSMVPTSLPVKSEKTEVSDSEEPSTYTEETKTETTASDIQVQTAETQAETTPNKDISANDTNNTEISSIESESQFEEKFDVPKIEFRNKLIEETTNKFLRTAFWAFYKQRCGDFFICNLLHSAMSVLNMTYYTNETIDNIKKCINVGNIVACDYGYQMHGEVNGPAVHSIVCKIHDNEALLVPITLKPYNKDSNLLKIYASDVVCDKLTDYETGYALLDKIRFVRFERIINVIGHVTPEFYEKLLDNLATQTFDFLKNHFNEEKVETAENIEQTCETFEIAETTENTNIQEDSVTQEDSTTSETKSDSTDSEIVEPEVKTEDTTVEPEINESSNTKSTRSNWYTEQSDVYAIIKPALEKLDSTKPAKEQIEDFLKEISFDVSVIITSSLIAACEIKKITLDNIVTEIHKKYPNIKEAIIKSSLRESFRKWIEKYPEIQEKHPKLGITSILKLFAKKFN